MRYTVTVTREIIEHMLQPGHEIRARCSLGLPDGATLTGAAYTGRDVSLTFEGPGAADEITLTPIFEAL